MNTHNYQTQQSLYRSRRSDKGAIDTKTLLYVGAIGALAYFVGGENKYEVAEFMKHSPVAWAGLTAAAACAVAWLGNKMTGNGNQQQQGNRQEQPQPAPQPVIPPDEAAQPAQDNTIRRTLDDHLWRGQR